MKNLVMCWVSLVLITGCQVDWIDFSPIDSYSAKIPYDDRDAPRHLSVAAVSIQPSKSDKQETLNIIKSKVELIKSYHPDIQVIVFGELILEWYYDPEDPVDYQLQMAETIPGPSTDFISSLARENQVSIAIGMTERDTSVMKTFNSQVLLKPTGEWVRYRKRNLNPLDIINGMSPGNELVTTDIDGIRVAMFICSDMQSERITKELANAKVDVILHSLTSPSELNKEISYVGMQFNTWIVFANRYGKEGNHNYSGFTQIINPAGTICERAVGKDAIVYRRLGIWN